MRCTTCGTDVSDASRFCSSCGSEVGGSPHLTRTVATTPRARSGTSSLSRLSSTSAADGGRFPPGAILAERYRIVALLGRGGMGEVYRADDLTLGQTVALKFLPESMAQNESALARFYNEVRIARQVSHPNVCRVYDLGESAGQPYLSMEYVDGEDLGSLLRRIGRLPADKGLEIARRLCAGVGAAHDKGVLHRDLKPSNIMIDSRGQVVVTDFGLAGAVEQVQGAEVRNGTPAYMAPEQLAGTEVSTASDIYALGLVLYELFTGKRAFEASTIAEMVRLQTQAKPPSMTALVRDLDPSVERVILRCLDPDPRNRPNSALAVSAALPGGDPLAAALAAGETPSPQMVAAAGEATGLRPRTAVALFAFVILGLIAIVGLDSSVNFLNHVRPEWPPDVLRVKAVELVQQVGYTRRPVDWAHGLSWSNSYVEYAEKNDKPRPDWSAIASGRPTPLEYWYRQSQDYLVGRTFLGSNFPSDVHWSEPPHTRPGMIRVSMDARGRLKYLLAMPPEREDAPGKPQPFDWNVLIRAAGFDPAQLQPAEPQWNSLAASDSRAAWTGVYPGPQKRPMRIEAAAWRGNPVFFRVVEPWDEPQRADARPPTAIEQARNVINVVLLLGALILAVVLGWRNHRLGRGDVRGASRLAALILVAQLAVWVFGGHHVPHFWLLATFVLALSLALFFAGVAWVLYMALEPYVRRRWPQTLISWSRLFAGRVRDPLVGSDILYGLVLAVIWGLLFEVRFQVMAYFGGQPNRNNLEWIESTGSGLASWLRHIPQAVQGALLFFFMLFVMRVVLRKQWLAVAAFALLFALPASLDSNQVWADFPIFVVIYGTAAYFLVRFGLVTLGAAVFGVDVMLNVPFTLDPSSWYFGTSVMVLLSVIALAGFAFHTAMAGRPLVKEEWFN